MGEENWRDPVQDPVTYTWSESGDAGSWSDQGERTATWTAPATAGTYTIKVTVSDQDAHIPPDQGEDNDPNKESADFEMVVIEVDLDIDGLGDGEEETPGGLVVRRHDDNEAARREIILQKAEPNDWTGNVVLSRNNTKVKVFDAAEGGNEITFNGTDNKFANADLPESLYVQGDTASGAMRDVTLDLYPEGLAGCKDSVAFTVLWVAITGDFSGTLEADNAGRSAAYSITAPHSYDLGTHMYLDRMGWGCEFIGTVSPSDFNQDIVLERDVEVRTYKGANGNQLDQSKNFSASVPPGNDTGSSCYRDDAPQSGGSGGKIYDWDCPGTWTKYDDPANYIRRNRANFKAFAVFDSTRASEFYEWYTKQSYKKTGASSSGTATGGTANTLQDTGKSWTNNEWQDGTIYISGGTGAGQYRVIASNTATTITVVDNWGTTPDNTSVYLINGPSTWTVVNDVANDNDTGAGQLNKLTWDLQ